jgi:hypothetical protein
VFPTSVAEETTARKVSISENDQVEPDGHTNQHTIFDRDEAKTAFNDAAGQSPSIGEIDLILWQEIDDHLCWIGFCSTKYESPLRSSFPLIVRSSYQVKCTRIVTQVEMHSIRSR